jgi:hypothetical protein
MNKNIAKACLAASAVFSALIIFSMPISVKSLIFAGVFIVHAFLYLDLQKKD